MGQIIRNKIVYGGGGGGGSASKQDLIPLIEQVAARTTTFREDDYAEYIDEVTPYGTKKTVFPKEDENIIIEGFFFEDGSVIATKTEIQEDGSIVTTEMEDVNG